MMLVVHGVAAAAICVACACSDSPSSTTTAPGPTSSVPSQPRTITRAQLRFDSATAVISSAQKFILPVPAFSGGGDPLRYPAGHDKAGQPIVDFEGKAIGERGIVFFNDKDKSVQAAAGDGESVIIINEVTEEHAAKIHERVMALNHDPHRLTVEQLRQVLEFARRDLALGDMYNSTRAFVAARMTPAVAAPGRAPGREGPDYGLKKRDDRDISRAIYVPGRFAFAGPAATPQVFDNGGVIVLQGDELRGVQPDVFVRTYRFADGRGIESASRDIAMWRPE